MHPRRVPEISPRGWDSTLATGAWNPARYLNGLLKNASREELIKLYETHWHDMDYMCLGNLWNKLGRYQFKDRKAQLWADENAPALSRLAEQTLATLDACNAQGLANIAHGLSKCGR